MTHTSDGRPGRRSPAGFYGWRMVALASIVGMLTGPGQSIGVSVFRQHLSDGLRLSDSAIAAAYLVGTLGSSTIQPRIGRWVDQVGVRRAAATFGVAFALVLAHMSTVHGVVWLAVGFFGIRLFGQGALALTSSVAVMHWFERRRGLALGTTMTVMMAGMSFVPVLLALAIGAVGWRLAWLVAAGVIALTVVPIGWFGFVDRPADLGQQVDGASRNGGATAVPTRHSLARPEALRTTAFWLLATVVSCNSVLGTGLIFHQTNLLGEIGYSNAEAAAMFLPQAAGAIAGGLAFGWLADRAVRPLLPAAVMLLLVSTLLLGGSATAFPGVLLYTVVLGLTLGSAPAVQGTLLPALFGVRHIASIAGVLSFVSVLSSSLGALVFSVGSDVFGGYRDASLWLALWPLTVAVLAALFHRRFAGTA